MLAEHSLCTLTYVFVKPNEHVSVHNECSASIYSSLIPSKMRFSSVGFVTSREVADAANQDIARRLFEYASQYE